MAQLCRETSFQSGRLRFGEQQLPCLWGAERNSARVAGEHHHGDLLRAMVWMEGEILDGLPCDTIREGTSHKQRWRQPSMNLILIDTNEERTDKWNSLFQQSDVQRGSEGSRAHLERSLCAIIRRWESICFHVNDFTKRIEDLCRWHDDKHKEFLAPYLRNGQNEAAYGMQESYFERSKCLMKDCIVSGNTRSRQSK